MICKKSVYDDNEEYYWCDHYGNIWFDGHCNGEMFDGLCEFYEEEK